MRVLFSSLAHLAAVAAPEALPLAEVKPADPCEPPKVKLTREDEERLAAMLKSVGNNRRARRAAFARNKVRS